MTLLSFIELLYSCNLICFIIDAFFNISTVIFLFITVKMFWNNLYCIKLYILLNWFTFFTPRYCKKTTSLYPPIYTSRFPWENTQQNLYRFLANRFLATKKKCYIMCFFDNVGNKCCTNMLIQSSICIFSQIFFL